MNKPTNSKIQISYSKLYSHIFCTYLTLTLVGFGQPISCNAASLNKQSSVLSTPSSDSLTALDSTSAPYVRKSRDISGLSATSAPESIDGQEQFVGSPASSGNSGGFFPYPSFKHKYQQRMSRFHGGVGGSAAAAGGPATRTYSIRSMTSFPKLNPLAGMLSLKSSEVVRHPTLEDLENEEQDPTFTPFISARALSNIPQFFQHLRSSLEALQLGDDDEEEDSEETELGNNERPLLGQSGADAMFLYGNEDEQGRAPNIPHIPEKQAMRWMPPTAGMTGRAHNRHFVNEPIEQELFYRKPAFNPTRNVYEFGLG